MMQTNILQITFYNETDKKISASLFQLFCDNLGLSCQPSYANVNNKNYFDNLKNWLLKNKFDCDLIRMQFNTNPSDINCNRIYFKPFMYQSGNPFGSLMQMPLFIVGECVSPKQYQSGIIEFPVDCEFDGFTTDIIFDVEPKERFVLTLFERITEEKKKAYEERMREHGGFVMSGQKTDIKIDKGLTPFKGFPIVVENESDDDLQIDLFNPNDYRKLAEYDKKGKVYIVFQGRENFGIKNVNVGNDQLEYEYVCSIEQMKIKKENRETRDIDDLVKRVNGFDCIRVVNPNQKTLNDVIVNGRTIKTAGYVDNGVCDIAVDVKLDSFYDYDSCIVTVPAKTNIMFSFGNTEEIIDVKPKRMVSHYSK